jgi:lipopolysaccharide/colanic/teichoic acid biosynthesis glycosyltransferase
VPVEHIGDQWAVSLPLDPPESRGLYRGLKRGLDLALAALGALVLGVMLIGLAPLMILDAGRPVFYRQTRAGRGGELFTLLKLRTMRTDAEDDGPRWSEPADERVTRVGRWLRRLGLDELPQCLNVLAGDMSLVGPRPERPEFVRRLAQVVPFYRARHAVRPGLTGWAAVNQGYVNTEDAALVRLQYDLYYIKHQSLLLDLYILLRTGSTVLRRS